MGNMSYCRFQSTLNDLQDCALTLYNIDGNLSELSKQEAKSASLILKLCKDLYFDFVEGAEDDS